MADGINVQAQTQDSYIGIEKLEDEFVVTSAEYVLSLANVSWTRTGKSLDFVHLCDVCTSVNVCAWLCVHVFCYFSTRVRGSLFYTCLTLV